MQINFANSRAAYDVALDLLYRLGYDVASANPTQSYVRSEVAISAATTQYQIPIVINQTPTGSSLYPTEKRVELQDIFVPTELGIFVAAPSGATAPATKLYTYENLEVFTGSGVAAALLNLWAGRYSMVVNNTQVLPAWDIWRHYAAPTTQYSTIPEYSTNTRVRLDSFNGHENGFYPVAPSFVLSGAANIQATINLPAAISSVLANSRIVVIHRGILLQNVTSVR